MPKPFLALLTLLFLCSCGSSSPKRVHVAADPDKDIKHSLPEGSVSEGGAADSGKTLTPEIEHTVQAEALAREIIGTALSFHGTKYKYGGTTKKGMDCSGLVYTSFNKADITMERTSASMATQGSKIDLPQVKKGDLLFFTTGRNRSRINHVGLVVEVTENTVKFIHSTTSRGVLVSSLREGYWQQAFHHARRIL